MLPPSLHELFDHPPRDFGPTPLWWWSGAPVTRERIRWQMEQFVQGGVHNLVVINLAPAGPLEEAAADDPPWFSEAWWDRFTGACEVADELGMRLWFYDQIGFSGANVQGLVTRRHPEAAGQALRSHVVAVHGGRAPVPAGEHLLAVHTLDGRRLDADADGRVDAPERTELRATTTVATAFDYLDEHAVSLLIDRVHGEFERRLGRYLGNVVAGSFQDELPNTNTWTSRFAEEFAARKGYDLLEELPALFVVGGTRESEVRADYYAVRTELTERALFRPLGRWHDERGMLLGADQTNPARAGVPTQSTQMYTDYFRTHRWYSAAGSDHQGDAKVHSSMAHLYGHPRVWMESFHSSGWGGTLEDTYDWLLPMLRSGANLYNPHASYFGTAGGWFEWAPPSTDWRQPYWATYPQFAAAVARTTSMMSWGTYDADVALLHPTTTAQAGLTLDAPIDHFGSGQLGGEFEAVDRAQREYLALAGLNDWFDTRPGLLDGAGIAFDVVDDASIQAAGTTGGRIAVREQRYATVVLPSATVLEEETARQLLAFLDEGGRVLVVGAAPARAAGRGGDDTVVAALSAHPRVVRVADPQAAVAAIGRGADHVSSDVPLLVRRDGDCGTALVSGAFPNASAYPLRSPGDGWRWTDYDFDATRYARRRTVTIRASVAEAELWNPATGVRTPVAIEAGTDAGATVSHLDVHLAGAPLGLLVWREGTPAPVAAPPAAPRRRELALAGGWTAELVPTLRNEHGDLALPAGSSVDELQVWSLEHAETDGAAPQEWAPTTVTFGQVLRTHPPRAAAQAPAPLTPAEVADVVAGRRPLADDSWDRAVHSASRGLAKESGRLGVKAFVYEEFARTPHPGAGEVVGVRTLVTSERPGAADLVVAAGAAKRVWWNGEELPTGPGYSSTAAVEVLPGPNVLEYRLSDVENAPARHGLAGDAALRSSFLLVEPGGNGTRPEFMSVGAGLVPDGHVVFSRDVDVPAEPRRATLVVGAATGLTVLVDGTVVARQEEVEYYAGTWGADPMYFSHDLTTVLPRGAHRLEVVTDSTDARDIAYVDLVVEHAEGVSTVVSGSGWAVACGGRTGESVEQRGHRGELAPVHAVRRTHPLPAARWLNGGPVVGAEADAVHLGDDVTPAVQWYRFRVPAGTTSVTVPVATPATAVVEGAELALVDGRLHLPQPLPHPADVVVRTAAVTVDRAGAQWSGPALVTTVPAPVELAPWPEIGLTAWSGAVRYRREVEVPAGTSAVLLDLGRLRGSVEVAVDGSRVGELFCAPYTVELEGVRGTVVVEVTVYGTLGPLFQQSTPTVWVFPSQEVTGLFGPVVLTCAEDA